MKKLRPILYWLTTGIVSLEMAVGAVWDLSRNEFVSGVMVQLGYPLYLLTILGVWKAPCALALAVPRFPRLKEWAYAGAFFNYTGAAASHLFVGDGQWVGPLVFTGILMTSWALLPRGRSI